VLGDPAQTAILLDGDGYVVAGQYLTADGRDLGADIGAQLSGVSEEANRAMRHLGLWRWRQIVFEAETASVAMAPSGGGVLLVAAPRSVPLGYVRRLLERSLERVRRWMGLRV
jgi:predicted regulator of Ras-like GTPase activity (Roadblock/LC7/MglB family)